MAPGHDLPPQRSKAFHHHGPLLRYGRPRTSSGDECCLTLRNSLHVPEAAGNSELQIPQEGGRYVVLDDGWRLHHCRFIPLCFFLSLTRRPSYICPHSAFLPTIAVPGNEEDYPRMSTGPSFAFKGRPGCGYGGMSLWMTRAILPSSPGWFFCSLHFNVGVSGGCFSRRPPWQNA